MPDAEVAPIISLRGRGRRPRGVTPALSHGPCRPLRAEAADPETARPATAMFLPQEGG
ncbi:MAG: hypothetical protein NZ602_01235 [Thermoguttaceae bacterium]|nr:hypothetical protein [Thermoguttaceae bacterium]